MKSKKAQEILQSGACHVCDGELMDGHRIGCDDLAYYVTAEEAIEQAEADRNAKAVEAFVANCREKGNITKCEGCTWLVGTSCELKEGFIQKLNEE